MFGIHHCQSGDEVILNNAVPDETRTYRTEADM